MHFIIPLVVFVTANIWGLFNSVPFTNINPARSFLERALGGVQLASTVYTLDQIPRLLDEEGLARQLARNYLGDWNITVASGMESAMTLSAGHRPLADAPLTVPPTLSPSPSSTRVEPGMPTRPSAPATEPAENLTQMLLVVILAVVVWLTVMQNDQVRQLTSILEAVGQIKVGQDNVWDGIVANHDNLTHLVSVARDVCSASARNPPIEEVDAPKQSHGTEGSTRSRDGTSTVVIETLQDVLASLDTLRHTIERSTDVYGGLSERLEVFQSGSQDTQPTESSGDDPNGDQGGVEQDK